MQTLEKNIILQWLQIVKKNSFHIISNEEQTSIIPEAPFSIIDKVEYLEKENLRKYILDLSFMNINKNYYRTIMKAIENRNVVEKATRFNWKNGFFREKKNRDSN